ncbi:MAG: hypothetical protein NT038_03375 [Euryarchaeota archaeon]|nr:hypothetical protein [Euryarchaeota archaeon]
MDRKIHVLVITLVMILSAFVFIPSIPIAKATILYVGGTGGGNYSKIQDAIDNASS